jgi:hypothetical protein
MKIHLDQFLLKCIFSKSTEKNGHAKIKMYTVSPDVPSFGTFLLKLFDRMLNI